MNRNLSELCSSFVDYIKQAQKESSVRAEQKRKYEEERYQQELELNQRLLYQQPYTMQLSGEQVAQIEDSYYMTGQPSVTLYPQQSQNITGHLIRQAVINNDAATQKEIVAELNLSFDTYLDRVRVLHKAFYDSFIRSYYPDITYADVTPVNGYFICSRDRYGLIYSFGMNAPSTINTMRNNFFSYLGTQSGKQLMRYFGIQKIDIGFDRQSSTLTIYIL